MSDPKNEEELWEELHSKLSAKSGNEDKESQEVSEDFVKKYLRGDYDDVTDEEEEEQ